MSQTINYQPIKFLWLNGVNCCMFRLSCILYWQKYFTSWQQFWKRQGWEEIMSTVNPYMIWLNPIQHKIGYLGHLSQNVNATWSVKRMYFKFIHIQMIIIIHMVKISFFGDTLQSFGNRTQHIQTSAFKILEYGCWWEMAEQQGSYK